jgi:hypothetical protein
MARPQVRLAMLLVLLMLMAGCISSDTPGWGTDDGQLKVEIDDGKAKIQSKLGGGFDEDVDFVECRDSTTFKVTGLLITSQIYDTHNDDDSIESAMGAAVIIDTMSWSDANSVKEGTAGRVPIQTWTIPLSPVPAGGSNEIKTNEESWEIIGIIPASENIADGLNVLEHWHQPIELTGYILGGDGALGTVKPDQTCELEGQGHAMVVTNIRTEVGTVSIDGENDDEYVLGDTDFFGRVTFILFFIIVGLGGGVGLFVASTMVIRIGAKATAETLLGREGFAKAVQMRVDLRSSKKDGLDSVDERAAKVKSNNPPPKKSSADDVAIPGFSLDNILASSDSDDVKGSFGEGGSVVVTSGAKEMATQPVIDTAPTTINNTPMPSSNVVSTIPEPAAKKGHFSSSMVGSSLPPQQSKAVIPDRPDKPVKRRSVKKRSIKSVTEEEPEPEPVVQNESASVSNDDDFSDFSF